MSTRVDSFRISIHSEQSPHNRGVPNRKLKVMYRLKLFFSTICVVIVGACTQLDTPDSSLDEISIPTSTLLESVQSRIQNTANRSYASGDLVELYSLKRAMLVWEVESHQANAHSYWMAFTNFHLAMIERFFDNSEQSARLIDQAISYLRNTEEMNSESQSLLAILLKEKIRYEPDETFNLMVECLDLIDAAIEANPSNARARLAIALTQVERVPGFGGTDDVKEVLSNALALLDSETEIHEPSETFDTYFPSWGQAWILRLQVLHVLHTQSRDEALEVLTRAREAYPDHYALLELNRRI